MTDQQYTLLTSIAILITTILNLLQTNKAKTTGEATHVIVNNQRTEMQARISDLQRISQAQSDTISQLVSARNVNNTK